jgi:hypothetical protein
MNYELLYDRLHFKKDAVPLRQSAYTLPIGTISFGTYGGSCCGITELCEFMFDFDTTVEEFLPEFIKGLADYGETKAKGIVHLTLTKHPRGKHPYQPQWFIDTLAKYPDAIHGPWIYNPNSGNFIQMWMLPLHSDAHA